jgi:hypothetical protein
MLFRQPPLFSPASCCRAITLRLSAITPAHDIAVAHAFSFSLSRVTAIFDISFIDAATFSLHYFLPLALFAIDFITPAMLLPSLRRFFQPMPRYFARWSSYAADFRCRPSPVAVDIDFRRFLFFFRRRLPRFAATLR